MASAHSDMVAKAKATRYQAASSASLTRPVKVTSKLQAWKLEAVPQGAARRREVGRLAA